LNERGAGLVENRCGSAFGRSAVEGWLRRIGHVELDAPGYVLAAKIGGKLQRAVDPGGDASREDPVSVDDDAFVDLIRDAD